MKSPKLSVDNMSVEFSELKELQLKLRQIPHLELNMFYDVGMMAEEYNNIKETFGIQGYNSDFSMLKEYYKERWMGISLNSEDGQLYTELMVRNKENDAKGFIATDAGKQSPYLMDILKSLGSENKRARILVLAPNSTVGWHSHYINYQKVENLLITQIPISMPNNFKYTVMNGFDYVFSDFKQPPRMYEKEYDAGAAYIFNSFHYHNVFNDSNEYRVTLEFHTDIANRHTFDIVKNAVDAYDGPLI
jgi:hypothetical protein